MKKLELKHLAGYFPYGLKAITIVDAREEFSHLEIDNYYIFDAGNIWTYCGYADKDLCIPLGEGEFNGFILRNENSYADINDFIKPILHPLSDLTKEIEHNGEKFVPIEWLLDNREVDAEYEFISALEDDWASAEDKIIFAPLSIAQKLYEWHFDIHGLIEKGLAIDINILKS